MQQLSINQENLLENTYDWHTVHLTVSRTSLFSEKNRIFSAFQLRW